MEATRSGLAAATPTVAASAIRTGDLVFYSTLHVGVYLGGGYMADASLSNGRVMVRRVYWRSDLRIARLA